MPPRDGRVGFVRPICPYYPPDSPPDYWQARIAEADARMRRVGLTPPPLPGVSAMDLLEDRWHFHLFVWHRHLDIHPPRGRHTRGWHGHVWFRHAH